ncbi:cutinase family protein [Rhodococcus maanshanensis]|uniref:cutinase family protein n=1 Tax=Rhodococcus maanshanensis TaxID=183556 RepID=UPI0022B4830E|nr:cutinase family protein [Rhodococcus maanshanensis]MCZ4557248.1 cutinase family protein [Rhodococcus maanshanensis]
MTVRGFIARHRIASAAIVPAVLGVTAILGLTWALSPAPRTADTELTSSVTECHDMVTVSIAGRNDTPVAGTTKMLVGPNGEALPAALSSDYSSHWVDPVINAPNGVVDPNAYAAVYIAYPANMSSYEEAVAVGVTNTESVMREIRVACPDTKFAVVGYSEGADVARRVAMDVGHQDADTNGEYGIVNPGNVVGVVILADAGRANGQGPFPGAKNPFANPDGFDRQYQNGTNPTTGQGALPDTGGDDFGALGGKVASFCSDKDFTCAVPENISLLQLAINVGRQLNVDTLEREGLTPATGQDVAVALSQIAFNAFAEVRSQPDWMKGDQTFLDVLLTVSSPSYKPGEAAKAPAKAQSISADEMSPLAYLPQKVFKEIIGLITTNQNTIPVVLSDPYQLTLAKDVGHHFDYWRDNDAANGKPLTSAEYAAAWLTHLAQQAQNGQAIDPAAKPDAGSLAAALSSATSAPTAPSTASVAGTVTATESAAPTTTTTTAAPTETSTAPSSGSASTPTTTPSAAPTAEAAAPVDSQDSAPAVAKPPTTAVAATTTVPTTTTPAPSPAG